MCHEILFEEHNPHGSRPNVLEREKEREGVRERERERSGMEFYSKNPTPPGAAQAT